MKCPCKECISYAICITQETIDCQKFMSYANHLTRKYPRNQWPQINKIFPKANMIWYIHSKYFYMKGIT